MFFMNKKEFGKSIFFARKFDFPLSFFVCLFFVFVFVSVAFNNFSVKSQCLFATGSSMLTLYSAASLKYNVLDTWHEINLT